jgi:hypothetical protein
MTDVSAHYSGRPSVHDVEHPSSRPVFLRITAPFGMGLYAFRIALSLFLRATCDHIYGDHQPRSFKR